MSTTSSTTPANERREKEIAHILGLLQSKVEDLASDIRISKELHQEGMGVKTGLLQSIESTLENPLHSLMEVRNSIDETFHNHIDQVFQMLFEKHKDDLHAVYKANHADRDIVYLICLKEDTFDHRDMFYEMLGQYESIEKIGHLFPVNFQFISSEALPFVINAAQISL